MLPEIQSHVRQSAAKVARAERKARRDPGALSLVTDARRELAEAKLTAYIAQVVEDAPPLTAEQCSRLALLLDAHRPGAA